MRGTTIAMTAAGGDRGRLTPRRLRRTARPGERLRRSHFNQPPNAIHVRIAQSASVPLTAATTNDTA